MLLLCTLEEYFTEEGIKMISNGKIWPYAIATAIALVFSFCVMTVIVTTKANVQKSDDYMMSYQDADENANEFIKSKMLFDKKYSVKYISKGLSSDKPIQYKIVDKNNKVVNNAKIIIAISRPETHELDQKLEKVTVENGVYSFSGAKFTKAGIYNIIAKVVIGEDSSFYNIKADTRDIKFKEY